MPLMSTPEFPDDGIGTEPSPIEDNDFPEDDHVG